MKFFWMNFHISWMAPKQVNEPLAWSIFPLTSFHFTHFPRTVLGDAPIHILRPVYMHLRKNGTLHQIHPRILDVLRHYGDDDSSNAIIPLSSTGLTPDIKLQLRKSLTSHLFGWDNLLALRMRLAVADFCWVSPLLACGPTTVITNVAISEIL